MAVFDKTESLKTFRSTKQLFLVSGDLGFRSLWGFICDRKQSPTRYLGQISEQICTSKRYKAGALPGSHARITLEENVWRTTKVSVFLGDFAHEEKLLTKLFEISTLAAAQVKLWLQHISVRQVEKRQSAKHFCLRALCNPMERVP